MENTSRIARFLRPLLRNLGISVVVAVALTLPVMLVYGYLASFHPNLPPVPPYAFFGALFFFTFDCLTYARVLGKIQKVVVDRIPSTK